MKRSLKNNNPKILFLTYSFFPLQSAEAILNLKLLGSIKGFHIDVLTVDLESLDLSVDRSLEHELKGVFKTIYRVEPPFWLSKFLFKLTKYFCFFPDRLQLLNSSVKKKAREIGISNYDCVISWSQWHSIHLVAADLKKKGESFIWLAHFSDPWSSNPFLPQQKLFLSIQRLLEKRVGKFCDAVNVTTEGTKSLMEKSGLYDGRIIFVTPHCFVPRFYKTENLKKREKYLTIRYLGNFYGKRNPINLFKALRKIQITTPNILDGVQFEFFGSWIGNQKWICQELDHIRDFVTIREPVDYLQSLSLMQDASVLMIIDGNIKNNVFLPSKLVDYLGAKRPIFAITPEGTTREILENNNGILSYPDDQEDIRLALVKLCQQGRAKTLKEPSAELMRQYAEEVVGKKLKRHLSQLL